MNLRIQVSSSVRCCFINVLLNFISGIPTHAMSITLLHRQKCIHTCTVMYCGYSLHAHSRTHIHTHTHSQLVIQWTANLVIMMEDAMKFINEFNITVETIDKLLPSMKPKVENIFYDLQSFAEAYISEMNSIIIIVHYTNDCTVVLFVRVSDCNT